ncbi:MAG: sigma factor-like helix-turn-helix DNA-binding protein [Ruminiclostridium sp.]
MNNERLAALIGEGGNDELLPLMWEKMRKLFKLWADKFYTGHKARCDLCGVTNSDLFQECYFVMLEAIKAYSNRKEEQAELKFISFCKFPFKSHAAALIGMRTSRTRSEPLNDISRISLDERLNSADGEEGDRTICDLIPDTEAEQPFREIEEADFCRAVRELVKTALADYPRQLEALERDFYNGETLGEIGAALGISRERARQLILYAMRKLRRNAAVIQFAETNCYKRVSLKACQAFGSAVEQVAEQREYCRIRLENSFKNYLEEAERAKNNEKSDKNTSISSENSP